MKISKIVTTIRDGKMNQWEQYREKELYRSNSNECNLKFFPIGKNNKNIWSEADLEKILGISHKIYQHHCDLSRPKYLAKALSAFDPKKQCFIIFDEPARWLNVLAMVFKSRRCEPLEVMNPTQSHPSHDLVFYKSGDIGLVGGFLPGLKRPLENQTLLSFAETFREHRPDLITRLQ